MKTISDKICRENENTICSIIFFRKSRHLWYNVEKYCRAGQATDDNMAHVYKLQLRNIWHVFDGEMWRHDSRKFYESVISDAEGRGGHDHLCCIIGRCEIRIFVWLNANLNLLFSIQIIIYSSRATILYLNTTLIKLTQFKLCHWIT